MQQELKLDHYQLAAECFGHESDVSLEVNPVLKFTEG
jgi:hypothetical protein